MGTNADLHFFLSDLMKLFNLKFRESLDCIDAWRLPIPKYAHMKNERPEVRKKTILATISEWKLRIKYDEIIKYNSVTKRIMDGYELLNNLTDNPDKQSQYIFHMKRLCEQQEILMLSVNFHYPTRLIPEPYIISEIG